MCNCRAGPLAINVFGVDLRADIGCDFGVGDGDSVDEPTGLVASAHMQHVVGHVGAGHVVGDHFHADGAGCAGGFVDLLARDEGGGGNGIGGRSGLCEML